MPKSETTASIHPSVDPSDKTPNDSGDKRRAATTVMTKREPLPARSANALYEINSALRGFAFGNDVSATVNVSAFPKGLGRDDGGICTRRARRFARGRWQGS